MRTALLALLLAVPASAHETWLLPRSFAAKPNEAIVLELTSGMKFPAAEHPIKPERLSAAKFRLGADVAELKVRPMAAKALELEATPRTSGVACLWLSLKPREIQLVEEKVEEYFTEIRATEVVRAAWAALPKPRQWEEVYTKHAKTFLRIGDGDDGWKMPTKQTFEFVPEGDPTGVRAGDELTIRVVYDGAPLAGFALGCVAESGDAKFSTTDKEGRAKVRFPKAGRAMLYGTHLRPAAKAGGAFLSDFATLTLEVK